MSDCALKFLKDNFKELESSFQYIGPSFVVEPEDLGFKIGTREVNAAKTLMLVTYWY